MNRCSHACTCADKHAGGAGRLVKSGSIKHSYPFCWRSDTPLIYRAVPSWFVKVESLRDRLLANNAKVFIVSAHPYALACVPLLSFWSAPAEKDGCCHTKFYSDF